MKDKALRELVRELIRIIEDKTRPENCYVNEWHVHEDWKQLKIQAEALLDHKSKQESKI